MRTTMSDEDGKIILADLDDEEPCSADCFDVSYDRSAQAKKIEESVNILIARG